MSWLLFESLKIWVLALETSIKKTLELYGPFLWMEFNCLSAIEPLQGDSLLFIRIIQLSRIELYNCIYHSRMMLYFVNVITIYQISNF